MLKLLFAGPIAAFLAVTSAAAADYTNELGRYRLTVPDGWTVEKNKEDPEIIAILSPRIEETLGLCTIHASEETETKSSTQTEIDAAFAGKLTREVWEEILKGAGFQQLAIETAGDEIQDGRLTQYFTAAYVEGSDSMKLKAVVHRTPGRHNMIFCAAYTAGFPKEATDFAIIFKSFTPLQGLVAMAPAARSPYARLSARIPALYAGDRSMSVKAAYQMKAVTARSRHRR